LDAPLSGAAAVASGGNNLLLGGDSYFPSGGYPQSLAATNLYWTYLPAMSDVRIAPGAVASGGMIIVYGGSDGISSMSTVVGYSPSGDTPQALPSMSFARSYLGYAPDRSGNAYALGGLDDSGKALSSAECYNQDSSSWAAIASLPTALYDFPAVFDRTNYIYTFGGITDPASGTEIATVLRYSVSLNTWAPMAPMPVPVAGSAAALGPDGKVYVVGGTSGGITTNLVQVYNPTGNSWAISTPLPEGLSAAAMGVDSLGRLIVAGGIDSSGNDVSDVWHSQQLTVPDTAPGFVSYPSTTATYLVPHVSSINATGSPQPTYVVLSGTNGLQVSNYNGVITWTPQASDIGTNAVTIQAANYAGVTNWSFSIIVPNPPPALVSNLTVVSVTENSVTLAWSPEDPVVGPVTYSVWLRHVLHSPRGSGATIWYTQIGSATTQTNITIGGLAAGLAQTYYLVATGSGGKSRYTGITATILAALPPTHLRVTGLTSTAITLAWDPPVGPVPVVSYRILGVFDGVFVQYPLSYVNINGTNVTLSGLTPGKALLWGVAAYDAHGNLSGYDYLPSLVINPVPAPAALTAPAKPPAAGGFQFTISEGGSVPQTVLIQATTNPADASSWVQIGSLLPATTSFTFTDTNASLFPKRFYRVVSP